MKRFSTLLTFVCLIATYSVAFGQINEGFETQSEVEALPSKCWTLTNFTFTNTTPTSGLGSIQTTIGTTARITTPLLDIPNNNLTISFNYTKMAEVTGERKIQIFLFDGTNETKIEMFNLKDGTNSYTNTFTNANTPGININGVRKVIIEVTPNASIQLDNLSINAPYHYGQICNSAPVAVPDFFESTFLTAFSGNVITNLVGGSDSDPDGETLSAAIVDYPNASLGTITMSSNGAFTFTPAIGFAGGSVTFTYQVTDNGNTPLPSNIATVTIEYPAAILTPLPVKLISFTGSIMNNKGNLRWSVADNETGDQFEVLRSADGKNFTEAGIVFINNKVGAESYQFIDARELDAVTYYKLKIINKDRSISYSNIIALKSTTDKPTTTLNIMKNPVESTLSFTYAATTASQGQVSIYNSIGLKVYSSRINTLKGNNVVSLNLDRHMAAGTYILEVVNGSERAVARMIKK